MGYSARGGSGYNTKTSRSRTVFGRAKKALKNKDNYRISPMTLPTKQANNLVIEGCYYPEEELFKVYPMGSFVVDIEDKYHVNNRWLEKRAKPIYKVVEVGPNRAVMSGQPISTYGKVVKTYQSFNKEDNEVYKQKAIADAASRNELFFKKIQDQQARIKGAAEKRAKKIAEKNKGQASLFGSFSDDATGDLFSVNPQTFKGAIGRANRDHPSFWQAEIIEIMMLPKIKKAIEKLNDGRKLDIRRVDTKFGKGYVLEGWNDVSDEYYSTNPHKVWDGILRNYIGAQDVEFLRMLADKEDYAKTQLRHFKVI